MLEMSLDASKGKAAIDNMDYESAVLHYSAALKTAQAPLWFLQRSTAYHRLGKYDLALADADRALLIAIDRGKRGLIAEAHFRRAIVLHGLKQYGNAKICFSWCNKYNEKQRGLQMWISKVKTDYDASGGEQADCNAITVKEVPDKPDEINEITSPPPTREEGTGSPDSTIKGTTSTTSTTDSNKSTPLTATPIPSSKIRYEWFQSQNNVTVEVFAKGIPSDKLIVDIQERSLEITFPVGSSHNTCNFNFEPLFSNIETTKSSFRLTPHKIEIVLHKSNPGIKWSNLQGFESISVDEETKSNLHSSRDSNDSTQKSNVPLYPTSSKNGPKNWDAVIDNEIDDDTTDGADAFFKMLYKNADLDTKRAMMKSYQESNGTSLSTQWSEVGSRKFEVIPPEGVEVKKWGT